MGLLAGPVRRSDHRCCRRRRVRVRSGGGARLGVGPTRGAAKAQVPAASSTSLNAISALRLGGLRRGDEFADPLPHRRRTAAARSRRAPPRRHRALADVTGSPILWCRGSRASRPRCAVRAAVPTLEAGLRSPAAVVRPTAAPGSGCSDAGPPVRGCISVPAVLPGPPARGSIGGAAPRIAVGPPVRCPGARSRRDRARGRGWPRSRTPSRRPPASSAPIASRARRAGRRGGHRDPEVGRYGDVSRGTGGVSRASRTGTVTGVWARSARR